MKLDIQIDMAQVQKDLKKTQLEMNRAISKSLLKTAQYGTQIILDRTAKGIGYEGKFTAYSPAYRKAKAEGWGRASGRMAFGGDASGIVNLNVHGEMLSSIQQRSLGSNVVEIFFGRATENEDDGRLMMMAPTVSLCSSAWPLMLCLKRPINSRKREATQKMQLYQSSTVNRGV